MENLIYLYALAPTKEVTEVSLPSLPSFDEEGNVYTLAVNDDITAIVCQLNGDEYSEEIIENKIDNDMEWLQKKALHHHETIETLFHNYTLIPLKFCTIYKSEDSLKESIQGVKDKVTETFEYITDKEEWTLKIYLQDEKLKEEISKNSKTIEEKRKEIEDLPRGKRFFAEKKIDSLVDKELEDKKTHVGEDVHNLLKKHAVESVVKKNWGKDVTGLSEDMILNSAYLISKDKLENFKQEIEEQKNKLQDEGWNIQATGPWPAYHFASF